MTAGNGSYFTFGYCFPTGRGRCGGYSNPFWTSYTYDPNTGGFYCN